MYYERSMCELVENIFDIYKNSICISDKHFYRDELFMEYKEFYNGVYKIFLSKNGNVLYTLVKETKDLSMPLYRVYILNHPESDYYHLWYDDTLDDTHQRKLYKILSEISEELSNREYNENYIPNDDILTDRYTVNGYVSNRDIVDLLKHRR